MGTSNLLMDMSERQLYSPGYVPGWLASGTQYLTIMGSEAYGINNPTSDRDIYGWAIQAKEDIFPHLRGDIIGFDEHQGFNQWPKSSGDAAVFDPQAKGGKGCMIDMTIYGVVHYVKLLADGNPNIIDSLFTPVHCVVFSTPCGQLLRENRRMFLSKDCWHRFKRYAYSQVKQLKAKNHAHLNDLKDMEVRLSVSHQTSLLDVEREMENRMPGTPYHGGDLAKLSDDDLTGYLALYRAMTRGSKRAESVKIHGYDLKYAYNLVRLLNEVEQILVEGDLDLQRNREQLKSIRRGEWTLEAILAYFDQKERVLEDVNTASKLRNAVDLASAKSLLMDILEMHFGSLKASVVREDRVARAFREIRSIVDAVPI